MPDPQNSYIINLNKGYSEHESLRSRHAWGATSRVLGDAGFLAITVDQRGHGESDWASDGDYGVGAYARDVRAVARQVAHPVALVGASLGGPASLLAVAEPPHVEATALVLVDVTPRMRRDGRERIGEFMRSRPDGFASLEEAADAVSQHLPDRPRPKDVSGLARTCGSARTAGCVGTGIRSSSTRG